MAGCKNGSDLCRLVWLHTSPRRLAAQGTHVSTIPGINADTHAGRDHNFVMPYEERRPQCILKAVCYPQATWSSVMSFTTSMNSSPPMRANLSSGGHGAEPLGHLL